MGGFLPRGKLEDFSFRLQVSLAQIKSFIEIVKLVWGSEAYGPAKTLDRNLSERVFCWRFISQIPFIYLLKSANHLEFHSKYSIAQVELVLTHNPGIT